ncbi:MarR family winged helix-turn-helix transcriptional regulator [Oleiharenicola lentus]|uniref:MarR family winged helix-turn-helix transcriptional regulator n=1 Tax=Oleiharenicola lentus TaxID=2508720 RepID=UPI003F66A84C
MQSPSSLYNTIKSLTPATDAANMVAGRALSGFMAASEDVRKALRSQLGRKGLTIEGFQALAAIRSFEPATSCPSTLADKIGTTRALLSHTLTRLEFSRLVTRHRDTADRRVIHYDLTPLGREALEKARLTCADTVQQLFHDVTEPEITGLISSCAKLTHGAAQLS